MIKRFCLILLFAAVASPAHAHPRKTISEPRLLTLPRPSTVSPYGEHYVEGYSHRDGTYIPGHFRANTARSVYGSRRTASLYTRRRTRAVSAYDYGVSRPVYSGAVPTSSSVVPPVSGVNPPVYAARPAAAASAADSASEQLPHLLDCGPSQVADALEGSGYTLYKTHPQKDGESVEFRRGNERVEVFYINGVVARWKIGTYR